jgi:hypothetical protein
MAKTIVRRRRNISLPTPFYRRVNTTLQLGTGTSGPVARVIDLITVDPELVGESYPRSLLVGGVKLSFQVDAGNNVLGAVTAIEAAVMKIPAGFSASFSDAPADLITSHPEWIYSYKFVGRASDSSQGQQYQPIRMESRRTKRLFTGDRLVLAVAGYRTGVAVNLNVNGVVSCGTRLD